MKGRPGRPPDKTRTSRKDYHRRWRRSHPQTLQRQLRMAQINMIKLGRGCIDCGYKAHASALDFDHRPGTIKRFCLARAFEYRCETIEAEIAKCDVRCANCHRIRTWGTRRTL